MRPAEKYAQNIRSLRLSRGIKARWMADQLGISSSAYSNLETGRRKIDLNRAIQIAAVLGISLQDIVKEKTGTEAGN